MKQDQHPHGFSSAQPGAAVGRAPQRLDGVPSQRAAAGKRASWGFLRRGGHSWQLPEASGSCPRAHHWRLTLHAEVPAAEPPHTHTHSRHHVGMPVALGPAAASDSHGPPACHRRKQPSTGIQGMRKQPSTEREGGQRGLTPGSKVMNSEMGPHPRSLASPPPIGQPGSTSMHKALRPWSAVMPGQSYSSK